MGFPIFYPATHDLFGYEMGDRILKKSVEMLQNSFLKPVIMARMEADHFVALVREEQLDLKRMMEVLRFTYGEKETRIHVQCRCGIYYIPADTGIKVSEMCDRAKLAKNYISNQYVQPYAIYQDSMKQDYEEECLVMINLDQAMERQEFQVYYQPIYEAKTGKIAAAEALVRWIPEPGRMVSPGRFIPILEKSGHITRLDFFVAEQVLTFQRERYHAGKAVYPVSVNLSRMDMKVVAEGVETAEQLSFLRDCDCDYIQGYYFSKPLLQEEYARGWMRNNFQIVRS